MKITKQKGLIYAEKILRKVESLLQTTKKLSVGCYFRHYDPHVRQDNVEQRDDHEQGYTIIFGEGQGTRLVSFGVSCDKIVVRLCRFDTEMLYDREDSDTFSLNDINSAAKYIVQIITTTKKLVKLAYAVTFNTASGERIIKENSYVFLEKESRFNDGSCVFTLARNDLSCDIKLDDPTDFEHWIV